METDDRCVFVSFRSDLRFTELGVLVLNHLKTLLAIDDEDFFKLEISLREAVNNAILHGNRLVADRNVYLKLSWSERIVRLVVEDESPQVPDWQQVETELAGREVLSSGGRGLLIIRNYMDEISLKRGERGNKIIMEKRFSENPGC